MIAQQSPGVGSMQRVYPAGFITRAAAFVIDLAIVAMISGLLALTIGLVQDFFQDTLLRQFLTGPGIENLWSIIAKGFKFAMATLFVLLYFAICWSLVGFTAGQFLVGVRVVRKNGELMSLWRALARILLFNLSAIVFFLGFFWVIFDRRRQAWHDKIVGTYVVYTEPNLARSIEALRGSFTI